MGVFTWHGHGRLIVGVPILRIHLQTTWAPMNRSRRYGHTYLMGAHNFTQKWAHILHYLHAQIYRTHGCTFVPTYPHKMWASSHTQTYPHFTHASPQISDAQTWRWIHTFQANFERPRVAWVAMNYVGLSRYCAATHKHGHAISVSFGCPCIIRGLPWIVGNHAIFVDAHNCKMHAHKVLWVLTYYEWAHTSYMWATIHYTWASTYTIWAPTHCIWSPKYVAIFTYLWATMILCVVSHAISVVAHNTACTTTTVCGCAITVVRGHPGKIWSLMRFAKCPRTADGHLHGAIWTRMSCTCTTILVHAMHTMWAWARICMRT